MSTKVNWDVDPDEWPHTPPLDIWRRLYAHDDNLVWRAGIGHVVNSMDEAFDRLDSARHLAGDWQANGNSRPLGDPTAEVWHKAARQLLAVLDGREAHDVDLNPTPTATEGTPA